ncbi:LysR substrate-binding domain-containing protein [Serratia nematodiphila]|uniref:LysR substrate-binding domain-containing protein n=1 Tax=Serratia nematodiphila TaxID=458197 RepID=UPI0011D890A3|nr:LysR substrate-binding domain-containing protein [Serratia nematodiphila]TXE66620.1 LysR family transcriptional regulator [Serratia nematodiphila]
MNITFKQLSVFASIAHSGSMTLAAEALFMTKGAISQALAELENQLGVRLFDRQHARLYINHEGRKLLPVADELLARMQGVGMLFSENLQNTQLRLGCTRTIGSYLLPGMLEGFANDNGWIPQPIIGNTQEISRMVAHFEIDVALLEGAVTDPNLISEPWLDDEMIVISGRDHPLSKENSVSYSRLSQERWLLREQGSSSRAFFDNQLALYLDNPQVALSLNAFDAILCCVARNLGITYISRRVLQHPFYAGHFVQLHTGHRFMRKFTLCYHKNKFISPTLKSWIQFCQS